MKIHQKFSPCLPVLFMVCSWHRMEREELKLARIAVKWPEMLGTYMNKTNRQGKKF